MLDLQYAALASLDDLPDGAVLASFVGPDKKLSGLAGQLQTQVDAEGWIARAMADEGFEGKPKQSLSIVGVHSKIKRLLLIGVGEADKRDAMALQTAGGIASQKAEMKGGAALVLDAAGLPADDAAQLGYGALLRTYRFDTYRTTLKPEDKTDLLSITVASDDPAAAQTASAPLEAIAAGVHLTRDLVSEPANKLYPETLAERAKAELEPLGVEVEILGEAELEALGFGSLLAVGMGSARESKMAIMKWNGAPEGKPADPIAFIGKGVTFDTGGISIKPAGGMEDMKWDMGGAGVVVGLMKALAGRKAQCNVIGAIGCVENMPSDRAQRPGDIVKSYSGQTIEVLNTDAEGRLVLADVLWYIQEQYKPQFMVDLATLTGAMLVALGHENAGIFSNNETLSSQIFEAGKATGDSCWPMPLGEGYNKQLDSPAADVKNIGGGRWGGAITAACFLERFVNGCDWAHLDIAGVTWSDKDKPLSRKGGTGWGVRLLDEMVRANYEG